MAQAPCERTMTARRVAAVCAAPEAAHVEEALAARPEEPAADLLWLTWVQWRAMGREAMVRETGLSLWTLNVRLRRLRAAGVPIPSWTEERELLARGLFHAIWK